MTEKCDALKMLSKMETLIEKQNCKVGHIDYEFVKSMIATLTHEIQMKNGTKVNDLKKDLGIYHNN